MRKALLKWTVCCAISSWLAVSAQAQTDSQDNSGNFGSSARQWLHKHLSATGRTNGNLTRATQLIGSDVRDSSGTRVGSIHDLMVDPSSGRVSFAVISLSSNQGAGSRSGGGEYGTSSGMNNSGTSGSQSAESGASSENYGGNTGMGSKLVPVPWSLLQANSSSSENSESTSSHPTSFTVNVDRNKLEQAPSLSRNNVSQLGQSSWLQRIYSFFGVTPESSTGGAESPSGSGGGSMNSNTNQQTPEVSPPDHQSLGTP